MADAGEQYGLYPWFSNLGETYVHPGDLEQFSRLQPYGKVFRISQDGAWMRLAYGSNSFRVKPDLLQPVAAPRFQVGASVTAIRHGSPQAATVVDVEWHHKLGQPFYFLRFDGKRSSRRYMENELE